jgi:hypothetical protein
MDEKTWTYGRNSSGKIDTKCAAPTRFDDPVWWEWVTSSKARWWSMNFGNDKKNPSQNIPGNPLMLWFDYITDNGKKKTNWNCLSSGEQGKLSWLNQDPNPADPNLDHGTFLMEQGNKFEERVLEAIEKKFKVTTIATSASPEKLGLEARKSKNVKKTVEAMERGDPIIYQGVLWEPTEKFYGMPDLLVRSDKLPSILMELNKGLPFPLDSAGTQIPTMDFDGLREPSPNLKTKPDWHYRVVDVKFSSLGLDASGAFISGHQDYHLQVRLYTRCLENILGCTIPEGYILGRCAKWNKKVSGVKTKFETKTCFQRLGRISTASTPDALLSDLQALQGWLSHIRTNAITASGKLGAGMDPLGTSPHPNLRPHASAKHPSPWSNANEHVAKQTKDLTKVRKIGVKGRKDLATKGITKWEDPNLEAEIRTNYSGITGIAIGTAPLIADMVKVNQSKTEKTSPAPKTSLTTPVQEDIEFYVDFETVNNDNDNLEFPSNGGVFPERGGTALIYMIGCGHIDSSTNKWVFKNWVTKQLSQPEEERIIGEWIDHMNTVSSSVGAPSKAVYCWSGAEKTNMKQAGERRGSPYPSVDWVDLEKWVKDNKFTVKGGWGTGLKKVIKPLEAHFPHNLATGHGFTPWPASLATDGEAALMFGTRASLDYTDMNTAPFMKDVVSYNEADCKTMYQFLKHIRKHHK